MTVERVSHWWRVRVEGRWLAMRLPAAEVAALLVLATAWAMPEALATDYTWASAATGGTWSGTTNWTPNGSVSGTSNTATLANATANRTVVLDTSISIGTLTLAQTTVNIQNLLDVQKSSTVSGTIGVGATSGTSRIWIDPKAAGTGTASVTLNGNGGITLNPGGVLTLGAYNPSGTSAAYFGQVAGNVTIQGGSLVVDQLDKNNSTGPSSATNNLTGNLTMTSGSLTIVNGTTNGATSDRRLLVSGALSITGGAVTSSTSSAQIQWSGVGVGTGTFMPTSFDSTRFTLTFYGGGDQSLVLGGTSAITARIYGVKTLTSTVSGQNVRQIQFGDASTADGQGTTLKLGSNLALVSGQSLPSAQGSSLSTLDSKNRIDVGIDADAYTFDLTGNTGVFTPNSPYLTGTSGTTTYWAFTGTAGRIIANGFNFGGTGTTSVATRVGPGLVLESKAASGVANDLSLNSGTGTIDPTSIFRYSGAAAVGTPSTLTSNRTIGDLEVTSGALQISATFAGLQALRVSGGTLDLGGNSLTVTFGSFGGGTVQSGTLTSGTFLAGSGTVSATLAGAGGLAKSGAGTFTLSGSNSYAGGTQINGGVLALGTTSALGTSGTISFGGGTLQFGTGNQMDYSDRIQGSGSAISIDTNGQSVTFALPLDASNVGGLTKSGSGTLTLTTSNAYTGGTLISSGTLLLGTGGFVNGAITNQGALVFNRSDAITVGSVISGTGAVIQSSTVATGVVTLAGANSYTGGTQVTSGSLVVQGDQSAATGGWLLPNSATFQLNKVATFAAGSVVVTATGKTVQLGNLSSSGSNNVSLTVLGSSTNNGGLAVGRYATLTIGSGGTWLQTGTMTISGFGGASATVNVNAGGLFTSTGTNTIKINAASGNSGKGTFAIAGGTFVTASGFEQLVSSTTTGSSTLALSNAGVLRLSQDVPTLTIASSTGNPLQVTLGAGGGVIDTNGFSTAIGVVVSGSGGLTKRGAGTLTLSASNAFTGDSLVSAGTLVLGNAAALSQSAFDTSGAGELSFGGLTAVSLGGLKGSGNLTLSNTAAAPVALSVGGPGSSTYDGVISGLGSLVKIGSGTLTLTGPNTFPGPTSASGGVLTVDGSLAGAVTVAAGAVLGGHGSVGAIDGAGLVAPGNSPGILAATSIDPSSALAFAFEFTQASPDYGSPASSGNDVLSLTGGTAFTTSLTSANTVNIYLSQSALALGTLTGGFFTATAADFLSSIQAANFQYFVQDPAGTNVYNGQNYKTLADYDASKSVTIATVAENGGRAMEMVVVPEPGGLALGGLGVAAAAWACSRRRRSPARPGVSS